MRIPRVKRFLLYSAVCAVAAISFYFARGEADASPLIIGGSGNVFCGQCAGCQKLLSEPVAGHTEENGIANEYMIDLGGSDDEKFKVEFLIVDSAAVFNHFFKEEQKGTQTKFELSRKEDDDNGTTEFTLLIGWKQKTNQ